MQFATFPETVVPYYPYFSFVQTPYPIIGGREHLKLLDQAVSMPSSASDATHGLYWHSSYQGIRQYHRLIDPTLCVWCHSLRALNKDLSMTFDKLQYPARTRATRLCRHGAASLRTNLVRIGTSLPGRG